MLNTPEGKAAVKTKSAGFQPNLLNSVINKLTDPVLITDAGSSHASRPKILYVNEAFERLTGYTLAEISGKSPGIFQGILTDKKEVEKLSTAIDKRMACEATVVNYKKNGEAFWMNVSINPIIDDDGKHTNWIAFERDVTDAKNEELNSLFLSKIGMMFGKRSLKQILFNVLTSFADFVGFDLSEIWLIGTDKNKISMVAEYRVSGLSKEDKEPQKTCVRGEGISGKVWAEGHTLHYNSLDESPQLIENESRMLGLINVLGLPIFNDGEVIGVMVMGFKAHHYLQNKLQEFLERSCQYLSVEITRKQVEEELAMIFNLAPGIMCIAGEDGYYKKINPAMCQLLEYTEQELFSGPAMSFVHPDDLPKVADWSTHIKKGSMFTMHARAITKSGKTLWLVWSTASSVEEGLFFNMAMDITEKKALEELLTQVTTLSNVGAWEIDILTNNIFWSESTKKLHEVGYEYQPDPESSLNFYKEGASRVLILEKIANAILHGTSWDDEFQIITGKGNERWIRVIGGADFQGTKCVRVYGSMQDIDTQKKAEIAANEALSEKNNILESIDDGFFAVDADWNVIYLNSMAERVSRALHDGILHQNLWKIFPKSIYRKSYNNYTNAVTSNQSVRFEEYFSLLDLYFEISAYPSSAGLSVYFKDITERVLSERVLQHLNQDLHRQTEQLASSNEELEQFAYIVSHDLQEPLRVIANFLTLLGKKYEGLIDNEAKEYIHYAVDSANKLRQIVADLLTLSTVGAVEDNFEMVDLNIVVADVIAFYSTSPGNTFIVCNDLPLLSIHITPIRQVFQNLISNAVKYQRKDGSQEIRISSRESELEWQFSVSDSGIGIEPEHYETIFDMFRRLHPGKQYSGTGIGLAIAKKIIESMHGKIWVESVLEEGSTFHFTILK